MKLRPLNDNLIIEPIVKENTTPSGLVLPDAAQDKPEHATVIATGDGSRTLDGTLIPIGVEVGEVILFNKHAGIEIKAGAGTLLLIHARDVLAVME
jgi:chaperonin GroES